MSSHRILPSWVSKAGDATKEDESPTTSTQQSAHFFRVECARTWHQRLYQAQRRAWSETVQAMMKQTMNPEEEDVTTVLEEQTTSSVFLDRYTIAPPIPTEQDCHNDEWLLPLTIVSPPPMCRLDRQAVTEALWDYFRTMTTTTTTTTTTATTPEGNGKNGRNRCCSLWLPRLLPTLHATIHLLARQCVQMPEYNDQEDHQTHAKAALRYYGKVSKKRTTSLQQVLLWWAARTTSYDSMVIVLEVRKRFMLLCSLI